MTTKTPPASLTAPPHADADAALEQLRATARELIAAVEQAREVLTRAANLAARYSDDTRQVVRAVRRLAAATVAELPPRVAPLPEVVTTAYGGSWTNLPAQPPAHYYAEPLPGGWRFDGDLRGGIFNESARAYDPSGAMHTQDDGLLAPRLVATVVELALADANQRSTIAGRAPLPPSWLDSLRDL